jgi:hypothetical protein
MVGSVFWRNVGGKYSIRPETSESQLLKADIGRLSSVDRPYEAMTAAQDASMRRVLHG